MNTAFQFYPQEIQKKILKWKNFFQLLSKREATVSGPSRVSISFPWCSFSCRVCSEVERVRSDSKDAALPIGFSSHFSSSSWFALWLLRLNLLPNNRNSSRNMETSICHLVTSYSRVRLLEMCWLSDSLEDGSLEPSDLEEVLSSTHFC